MADVVTKEVLVRVMFESRQASLLVQSATRFECKLSIQVGNKIANAKSILGIINLCVAEGTLVSIIADGPDERQAVLVLEQYLTRV